MAWMSAALLLVMEQDKEVLLGTTLLVFQPHPQPRPQPTQADDEHTEDNKSAEGGAVVAAVAVAE